MLYSLYMNNKFIIGLVLALVVLLGLYLAFSSQTPAPANAPANTTTTTNQPSTSVPKPKSVGGAPITNPDVSYTRAVKIQGFKFDPETNIVPVGTTVTWTNYDSIPHTVTSNDGFFASKTLTTASTFSYKFTQKGTYYYHCTFHPEMLGRIIVQ